MNVFFTNFKELFLANKRILIPLIPLVLFILVFIGVLASSLFSSQTPSTNEPITPAPTRLPGDNNITTTPLPSGTDYSKDPSVGDADGTISNEDASNFEKKVILSDGSIKYSLISERAGRPNIVITTKDELQTIFERSVNSPSALPLLSDYLNTFGQPEQSTSISKFYGSSARTYIYSQSRGFAFIADFQKNTVLEAHYFSPMSVDEYIKKYGQD